MNDQKKMCMPRASLAIQEASITKNLVGVSVLNEFSFGLWFNSKSYPSTYNAFFQVNDIFYFEQRSDGYIFLTLYNGGN